MIRSSLNASTRLALCAALLAVASACGDGSSSLQIAYDPPPPGDPAHGATAQVMIQNSKLVLWVGIDDQQPVDKLRSDLQTGKQEWLVGTVVADATYHLGFYFSPADITVDEITAEGIQTTLAQITADPHHYVPGGPGGFQQWAVIADVLAIE